MHINALIRRSTVWYVMVWHDGVVTMVCLYVPTQTKSDLYATSGRVVDDRPSWSRKQFFQHLEHRPELILRTFFCDYTN